MSRRVLIDTSAYSALMAGSEAVAAVLAEAEAVLVSAVVVGELLDGFRSGSRARENGLQLARFRSKPRTVLVPVTDETAEWFAELKGQLRRKGTRIPINDVWIAAGCMEHGAVLLTLDRHFAGIEGLRVAPLAGDT